MTNVVRFTLPTARDLFISGVGAFRSGVLDIDANKLSLVARARFLVQPYRAVEVGIVDSATPAPTLPAVPAAPAADPYPQYLTATEAAAYVAAPPSARFESLSYPKTWAHRGGQNLFPENSAESVEGGLTLGSPVIDLDCQLTADGIPVAMHDATLDRTTSLTGNVSDYTYAALSRSTILDASNWFGGGWPDLKVRAITELFQRAALRGVTHIEAKQTNSMPALISAVLATGMPRAFMLGSFNLNAAGDAAAAGIPAVFYMSTGSEATPAAIAAKGIAMVGIDYTAVGFTSGWVSSMHAAGIKVSAYTVQRQIHEAAAIAKGADAIWSNDPSYTQGPRNGYAYVRSAISFASGAWDLGMYSPNGTPGVFSGGGYGWNDTSNAGARTTTLGMASPAKKNPAANAYVLDYVADWTSAADTGRWIGGYFCMSSDDPIRDNGSSTPGIHGYRWLLTPAGTLQVSKYTDGLNAATFISAVTPALTLPQTNIGVRITVTPTSITAARTDTTGSATDSSANATAYRGGYHSIAMNGSTARFKSLAVS